MASLPFTSFLRDIGQPVPPPGKSPYRFQVPRLAAAPAGLLPACPRAPSPEPPVEIGIAAIRSPWEWLASQCAGPAPCTAVAVSMKKVTVRGLPVSRIRGQVAADDAASAGFFLTVHTPPVARTATGGGGRAFSWDGVDGAPLVAAAPACFTATTAAVLWPWDHERRRDAAPDAEALRRGACPLRFVSSAPRAHPVTAPTYMPTAPKTTSRTAADVSGGYVPSVVLDLHAAATRAGAVERRAVLARSLGGDAAVRSPALEALCDVERANRGAELFRELLQVDGLSRSGLPPSPSWGSGSDVDIGGGVESADCSDTEAAGLDATLPGPEAQTWWCDASKVELRLWLSQPDVDALLLTTATIDLSPAVEHFLTCPGAAPAIVPIAARLAVGAEFCSLEAKMFIAPAEAAKTTGGTRPPTQSHLAPVARSPVPTGTAAALARSISGSPAANGPGQAARELSPDAAPPGGQPVAAAAGQRGRPRDRPLTKHERSILDVVLKRAVGASEKAMAPCLDALDVLARRVANLTVGIDTVAQEAVTSSLGIRRSDAEIVDVAGDPERGAAVAGRTVQAAVDAATSLRASPARNGEC